MPGQISYRKIIYSAGVLLLLATIYSCSTKKNTFTRRLYHNITSRYNVYFNGEESLNEGTIELLKGAKNNYTKVLPVFNFGTKQEAQQLNPQMDRAIQKASIAIQKHSMPFGGSEMVKWIDDSYLMIGKAYFYKQEYFSARRTFNFIIQEYGYNDIKYDAMIWLALTYNQTEEYEKTEPLLNLITTDVSKGLVPQKIIRLLPQVYADLYIRQEYYDRAVDYLVEGIFYNPKRDLKTRLMFILGQIYQQDGDFYRASEWYDKVIRRNPDYDMAFQAKINLAKSYDTNSGDRKQITKILSRMLKDDKNKDYKDQVYYALADVAMRDQDTAMGIEYLRMSVSSSVNNNYQLAKSSLTLADIYFEMPSYENAQAYYDTAMMSLPNDYPDYTEIERKTKVLNDLVENLITIQHEDSLQRLVNMSDAERNAVIDKIITAYYEEQQRLAEQQRLEQALVVQEQATSFSGGPGGAPGLPAGGKWYFYNIQTKDFGYAEFIKKWGKRKYEDLWRISDKQLLTYDEELDAEADTTKADSVLAAENNPTSRQYYLKNLPFTEEQLAASDLLIMEAYFNSGKIYKDGLKNNEKSRDAFLTMNERYPDNENKLISYYYLYKIYLENGPPDEAEYYKNLIITQYPESDYAKVLADPEYYAKIAAEKNKVNILYEETYKDYKSGQYFQVIAKSDLAFSLYGDTMALAPNFAYLKAISVGKIDVVDSLVSQLTRLIRKYPGSEVKPLAQNILASLIKDNPDIKIESTDLPPEENVVPEEEPESPYKINPGMQHMFIIAADSKEIRLNPFKVKLSDYNQKYYSTEGLSINSLVLDNEHYLITVGNFNNAAKAREYFDAIIISEYVYADLKPGTFYNFVISTENYPIFFKEKDIGGYSKFFDSNYTK